MIFSGVCSIHRKLLVTAGVAVFSATVLTSCSGPGAVEQAASPTSSVPAASPTTPVETAASGSEATIQATEAIAATSTPEPTAEPSPPELGATRVVGPDQMEQVYVPAGEFLMGSDDDLAKKTIEGGVAYPENPMHTVFVDGFWIDKFEITTGQYAQCVDAGVCQAPWVPSSATRAKYYGLPEFSNYPVLWVNWYMAKTYCEWAGRRQPSEAEWEKAARGTDGRLYPWGNDPVNGKRANYCDVGCPRTYANLQDNDGYPDTAPVGSYPAGASPYGALDMAGNVWEWTGTLLQDYPYDAADGREDPYVYGHRVWRGGPWANGWWWMRTSLRYHSVPTYWWFSLGFRCASSE